MTGDHYKLPAAERQRRSAMAWKLTRLMQRELPVRALSAERYLLGEGVVTHRRADATSGLVVRIGGKDIPLPLVHYLQRLEV